MCGIAGVYDYGHRAGGVSEAILVEMRETLHHRGPDGEGLFVSPDRRVGLAHRRLAIVDIAGGAQPMVGRAGDILVFNGEIYNYPTLRRELEADGVAFRTDCDTEVILHLYERHGEGCLEHLNGMFAFALWDPAREALFLARDRLGEKPLYWSEVDGALVFGSEIKALLKHPGIHADVNESAISPYLTHLVVPSPETLYKGIYKLPVGTKGICDRNGMRLSRYWDLLTSRTFSQEPLKRSAGHVRRLLDQSINARLMSDVPVGVLLSGGLDSTTIVALLRERAANMATFSVGFAHQTAIDERDEARQVARHFGTEHHEVEVSEQDALGFLQRLVHHQDEPLADPVCIPLHFVCELAQRNGVKVVLAGEGADELFWGYTKYQQILRHERWMRRILAAPRPVRAALARAVPGNVHPNLRELLEGLARGRPWPMHMPLGLTQFHRRKMLRDRLGSAEGWSFRAGTGADEDLVERLGWDTQEYQFGLRLPELLLMRIDRFSMANSVEARVPFLDPDLVKYGYSLPFDQKLNNGTSKVVLREAVSDVVPDWVLKRPKKGFGAPVVDWFSSQLEPLFRELLTTDAMRAYFNVDALEVGLRETKFLRNRLTFSMWFVLNFALWHRYWIENEPLDDLIAPLARA